MADQAVTVLTAARELHISPSQLRRWIRAGAPIVSHARPMRVRIDDVRRWRAGADPMAAIADALWDALRRDCGVGGTAPHVIGIDDRRAAALLLVAFDRMHIVMTGREPTPPWAAGIQALRSIAGGE